jgi:hypothetical protein
MLIQTCNCKAMSGLKLKKNRQPHNFIFEYVKYQREREKAREEDREREMDIPEKGPEVK